MSNKKTKVFGRSIVEFEGGIDGEVGCYGTYENEKGVLLIFSDGTLLEAKYGKAGMGIWEIKLLQQGSLFQKIDPCMDESADPYSDVAHFKAGIKWAYSSMKWGMVK